MSQLSLVAEGIRIKISRSPMISAVQRVLLGLAVLDGNFGSFTTFIEGRTERLFGPGEWTTVIVRVEVFTTSEEATDVRLGTKAEEIVVVVEEMERAGTVLLLIDIAGAETER